MIKVSGGRGGDGVAGFVGRRERAAVGEVDVVSAAVWGGVVLVEIVDVVVVSVAFWVVRHRLLFVCLCN